MPVRVTRAGSIPRLTDQEIATGGRFGDLAVDPMRALVTTVYASLSPEEAQRLGAEWYEACAHVLHFGSLGKMSEFLRREVGRIGADPELKTLRAFFAAMNQTYQQTGWTAEAVAELQMAVEGVLADMGLVEKPKPQPAEAQAAAKAEALPVKKPRRARVAMTARVQALDSSAGIDEIVQTESVTREGIVFLSTLPYKRGMRLSVILPYTKRPDEDKFNIMTGEVTRIEPGEEKPTVEVKFVR